MNGHRQLHTAGGTGVVPATSSDDHDLWRRMRAELVCDALRMATEGRRPMPGLIFHSDRGSQYTSGAFRALLGSHGMSQSLAEPRQWWDKAVAESFWST